MMNYIRYALYGILVFVGMQMYQIWDKEHPKAAVTTQTVVAPTAASASNNYIPEVANTNTTASNANAATTPDVKSAPIAASAHIIHVQTDVLDVDIDAQGGNITQVKLVKYPEQLHSSSPFVLLNNQDATRYLAQSGLLSTEGPDTSKGQALYTVDQNQTDFVLAQNQNQLQVKLNWQDANGVKVTKTFNFQRDDYEIGVDYQVQNQSKQAWEGNVYLQLMRKDTPPSKQGLINLTTYFGAAISSPAKTFQKITFKDMIDKPVNQTIVGGWAAMVQHYFVSAWIPDKTATSQYFSHVTTDGLYTIGALGPKITAAPGTTVDTHAKFYAGPAIAKRLEHAAPGLQLTIDFGIFWIIAVTIFWMMAAIHSVVGNWGWSIVLVTLVIKLMFYHLSAKSYRSMSVLKKLQPRINTLKERYGDDKQKFTQATLELYKKEKVNPMSGCLPILIQIPVFIGLYWVLIESVELRQAPFILWIQDLTQKDPFYVLPVLMGISMFLQQRLNPPPPDPMQAKVMMFMPVVFTALFVNFPAGLMLYWFVNNTLSFLQQWFIMRSINNTNGNEKSKSKK
ncbi:MAG: membrane protein insertase YidC [Gammaproteobacteria bacterium]|nr:membrane protein insertase YidC [Gammaproteobacteria bacterium]